MAKQPKRCIHRQDEEHHPNCFNKLWYKKEGERIGYLDIETSGLDADNDWMLSWAIKERKSDVTAFNFVTFDDIFLSPGIVNREFDRKLVKRLLDEMEYYTGFVTYYGTGFDIKFIRSKAMQYGFKFPKFGEKGHIDLY